jgi:hypothetical protein
VPGASRMLPRVCWQRRTTTPTTKMKIQKSCTGKEDVGPTYRFTASPEVGPGATIGTLQTGYPRVPISSQDKGQSVYLRITTCSVALDPTSLHRRALVLSRIPRLWTLPPYRGGLRRCHTSCGFGARLPAQEGSSVVTRPAALRGP